MKSYSRTINTLVRNLFGILGLNIQLSPVPGIAICGFNIFRDYRKGPIKPRSFYALEYVLKLPIKSVLDVGSGAGHHARIFSENNYEVICVDFGLSVYSKENVNKSLDTIYSSFQDYEPGRTFDLIWASHILEHQRNVGQFLDKCVACCANDGYIAITVPDQHRLLLGGHLTHWSPGLLIYNMVMCGLDMSNSVLIRGSNELSVVCKKKIIDLPKNLSYDKGDIDKLIDFMPPGFSEQCDLFLNKY